MINDSILDITRLRDAFGDDDAGIADFLGMARETERKYIVALNEALEAGDLEAVGKAAHSIKGSASNIGASHLSAAAAALEDTARAGRADGIADLTATLSSAYDELCARIDAWVDATR